jgi:hypothetical protein
MSCEKPGQLVAKNSRLMAGQFTPRFSRAAVFNKIKSNFEFIMGGVKRTLITPFFAPLLFNSALRIWPVAAVETAEARGSD